MQIPVDFTHSPACLEIVAGLAGGKASSERPDPAVETGDGALDDPTQTGREFAEWHLDGVRTDEYGGR